MADLSNKVQGHYTRGNLHERIFRWLAENDVDPDNLNCEQLHPLDQLHSRGIRASREHAEHAEIKSGIHVLDLGCGIGGASRFLASEYDCQVTGIDLTEEFVGVAKELTKRCGLADRIEYRQADATALPFEDGTFDHVWCHNVTMNIEDKAALVRETARVLRRGGRFSCAEVGQGPGGPPSFPLPWATDATSSFLVTPEEMANLIEAGGLHVIEQIDLTDVVAAFRKEEEERVARGERPLRANHIAMGDDFPNRTRNMAANTDQKRVVEHIIVAEKT